MKKAQHLCLIIQIDYRKKRHFARHFGMETSETKFLIGRNMEAGWGRVRLCNIPGKPILKIIQGVNTLRQRDNVGDRGSWVIRCCVTIKSVRVKQVSEKGGGGGEFILPVEPLFTDTCLTDNFGPYPFISCKINPVHPQNPRERTFSILVCRVGFVKFIV